MASFAARRARRILVPWAIWWSIYLIAQGFSGRAIDWAFYLSPSGLLSGPWIGLWYLPFAFVGSVVANSLFRQTRVINAGAAIWVLLLVSIVTIILATALRVNCTLKAPWAQWVHALPSIPIGVLLQQQPRDSMGRFNRLGMASTTVLIVTILALYRFDSGMAISYGIGSGAVAACLTLPRSMGKGVTYLASLTFGVYLMHGLLISMFKRIEVVREYFILWFVCATTMSFLMVAILKRLPVARRIV